LLLASGQIELRKNMTVTSPVGSRERRGAAQVAYRGSVPVLALFLASELRLRPKKFNSFNAASYFNKRIIYLCALKAFSMLRDN
jgi:hypothetical protein